MCTHVYVHRFVQFLYFTHEKYSCKRLARARFKRMHQLFSGALSLNTCIAADTFQQGKKPTCVLLVTVTLCVTVIKVMEFVCSAGDVGLNSPKKWEIRDLRFSSLPEGVLLCIYCCIGEFLDHLLPWASANPLLNLLPLCKTSVGTEKVKMM